MPVFERAPGLGFTLGCLAACWLVAAAPADAATQPFQQWLEGVRAEALDQGIRTATLNAALSDLKPIPRVIELDRRQSEFTWTFEKYLSNVVPQSRVERGRRLFDRYRDVLSEVGRTYHVQPRFIVALWGVETDFGRNTGGYPVIGALATLAYDGRRSDYFRSQLLYALKILDDGHVSLANMQGSWAGAMGQSQFMPESFLRLAVDQNGDGRRDIWTTEADVFASAANYLAKAGWKDDQTWGREVRLPAGFDTALAGLETRKRLGEWQALGVRRADGRDLPTRQLLASLILPEQGATTPAYLVYDNFRAVRRWNPSNYFALAVGILSDAVAEDR